MLLRVDWREKAGSVRIVGRGEGSRFKALLAGHIDRYPPLSPIFEGIAYQDFWDLGRPPRNRLSTRAQVEKRMV
jgi:hypothetical protein